MTTPSRSGRRLRRGLLSGLPGLILIFIFTGYSPFSSDLTPTEVLSSQLPEMMDQLRSELDITARVVVATVPRNERLVSVERLEQSEDFLLLIDREFLGDLDEKELRAALAHEMGHVWIFSHHPYLQTEALANRIAMQVVSREMLTRVYRKMWLRQGISGDLDQYLGSVDSP